MGLRQPMWQLFPWMWQCRTGLPLPDSGSQQKMMWQVQVPALSQYGMACVTSGGA